MSTETDTKVIAEVRENFGKGFARRLRAAGKIPAVIYGHGTDPVHVALPGHQVALLVRRANVVLELEIAGAQQLTLVKDVQKDPVHQIIEHIDLLVVKKGEKVQVDVPVVVVGEPFAGTIATSTTRPCRSRSRPRTSPRTSRSTSRASRTARTSPRPT
jgi:large subunit ribosomal protein L25